MFDHGDPTGMISTRTHGMIDYAASTAAMTAPFLMGFGPKTTSLLTTHAVAATGMSMLTDYEAGVARAIPMEGHLAMDVACGLGMLVAAGTVLKDERGAGFVAMMGVAEILTALMTEKPALANGSMRGWSPADEMDRARELEDNAMRRTDAAMAL